VETIDTKKLEIDIEFTKKELDAAREKGDTLRTELLESALNNLLECYSCNACHA
jgi:hypothetical protein